MNFKLFVTSIRLYALNVKEFKPLKGFVHLNLIGRGRNIEVNLAN